MARRPLAQHTTRNIQNSKGTYYISIPIEIIQTLGWKERQKVVVRRRGKKIIIEDWGE
ncbi:AbrB/MazE/SpoVT family DNA-binding domain-containing protein [Candidatus Uhrbacteria bacterium]|nr:AbrB/MazE/SpoVT family DNA-binding domain-containing protein [Candidatus Uhrbacteria bacterium]